MLSRRAGGNPRGDFIRDTELCLVGPPNAFGRVVLQCRDTSQRVFCGRKFYRNETVYPCEVDKPEGIQRLVVELEGLR